MRLAQIYCMMLFAFGAGCSEPTLSEITAAVSGGVDPSMYRRNHFADSALIVTGTILNIRASGKPRASGVLQGVVIMPLEIIINVDTVLKGVLLSSDIRVMCNVVSESSLKDVGARMFVPEEGQRRVFFLRGGSNDSWRLLGDIFEYSIQVYTGVPTKVSLAAREAATDSILEILLIPTRSVDETRYCRTVARSVDEAIRIASIEAVVGVLGKIRATSIGCIPEKVLEQELLLKAMNQDTYCAHSVDRCLP